MKVNKGKHEVRHLGWNNLMQQQRLGTAWLDSNSAENILEGHGGQVEHEWADYYCSEEG